MTTKTIEKIYMPLYAHFSFYKGMFGLSFLKACERLADENYILECYPGHCDKALPYILASYTSTQKIKVHLNPSDNTVDMIEVCENDDGVLHYRKLFSTE